MWRLRHRVSALDSKEPPCSPSEFPWWSALLHLRFSGVMVGWLRVVQLSRARMWTHACIRGFFLTLKAAMFLSNPCNGWEVLARLSLLSLTHSHLWCRLDGQWSWIWKSWVRYSMRNIVNNIVTTMHGVRWVLDLLGWSLPKLHKCVISMSYPWN